MSARKNAMSGQQQSSHCHNALSPLSQCEQSPLENQYKFVNVQQFEQAERGSFLDFIGVVKSAGDLVSFTFKHKQNLLERDIKMVDRANHVAMVKLWGVHAKINVSNNPVLVMRGAKVSEYGGLRFLSVIKSSHLEVNPDCEEARELRKWYDGLRHSPRTNSVDSISTTKSVQSESSDLKKRQASNYSSVLVSNKCRKRSPNQLDSSRSKKKNEPSGDESVPPHEKDLCRLCWVPFGMQTLKISPVGDGHTYQLQPNTVGCDKKDLIRLEVPNNAINTAVCKELSIRYGILVHGPFVLEGDYDLASMVVYIDFNPDHTTKPLMLHLPHWAGEGKATSDVFASHKVDEIEQYKFAKKSLLPSATGSIPIYGHCSLFAKAIEVKSQKFYYAHPLESREDTETKLSVYFTYASTVWSEIIQSHVGKCKPPSKFQLENEDKLNLVLGENRGSGWEADLVRKIEITEEIIHYNPKSKGDLKKDVCELQSYPPFVECVVQCTRKALKGGRRRRVNLVFNKMQAGLAVTRHNAFMSFACTTFSEEPIGGHASSEPPSFGSNFTPPASPPDSSASSEASEDKSKKKGSKSTKRSRSYSEVTVKDVIRGMTRKNLHSGIKNMLTEHRINLLCDDWELINEECRDDILGDLEANKKTKAVDRLIDYFHDNHTGEKLLHFCAFLTKEAKDAGRNAQLLKLANAIQEAVRNAS